jgi:hypothetical protein
VYSFLESRLRIEWRDSVTIVAFNVISRDDVPPHGEHPFDNVSVVAAAVFACPWMMIMRATTAALVISIL